MLESQMNVPLAHVSQLLAYLQSPNPNTDTVSLSGIIKRASQIQQSTAPSKQKDSGKQSLPRYKQLNWRLTGDFNSTISSFDLHREKLELTGISFGTHISTYIQQHLRDLMMKHNPIEIRFWGVVRGLHQDYYVIQALKDPYKINDAVPLGAEKNGEGANYYTYWVSNNLLDSQWTELPEIEPHHIQVARQIKKLFTGNLEEEIHSSLAFKGREKHYLKAQLVRMTHSLELSPKGIYKPNDENPKLIEYEEEVKVPDFAELNSLEGWVHKNQMVLNLGRCSHFVDPKLSEEEIEAKTAELAEKDPEAERLKPITEDKVPEELALGVENPWIIKVEGNTQVFTKDDLNLVYGVVVLRNIYWPGWITIGYKSGYANIYIGNGLKSTQPSLHIYQNPDLSKQAEEVQEYPEPNPKQLPVAQPVPQEPKPQDE